MFQHPFGPMLDCETKYFLYVFGFATAVGFQSSQEYARGLWLIQQNFPTRDSVCDRLAKAHGGQAYGVAFNQKREVALLDLGPMGNGCGGWIYEG